VIPITPAQKRGKIKMGHLDNLINEYNAQTLSGMKTGGGSILELIRKRKEFMKAQAREQKLKDKRASDQSEWDDALLRSNSMLYSSKNPCGLPLSKKLYGDTAESRLHTFADFSDADNYTRSLPGTIRVDDTGKIDDFSSTFKPVGKSPAASTRSLSSTFRSTREDNGRTLHHMVVPATEHTFMKSSYFPKADDTRFEKMYTHIQFKTPNDEARMFEACIYDEFHVVRGLLEIIPDAITKIDENGNSLLCTAALHGAAVTTELLLYAGAEVDHKNNFGLTAFDLACVRKHKSVASLLLIWGTKTDFARCTPKYRDLLLAEQQKLESQGKVMALFRAVEAGDYKSLDALINDEKMDLTMLSESDPSADISNPYSLLHVAMVCHIPSVEIVKLLLQSGSVVNGCDANGDTPLHVACGRTDVSDALLNCIYLLIEREPQMIVEPNFRGRTPIFHACHAGTLQICDLLLKNATEQLQMNSELGRIDVYGRSCVYYANMIEAHDLSAMLVSKGFVL
jgi:ankyrin repeat protein